MKKIRKRNLLVALLIAALGFSGYLAADRYLIRHVEIADVSVYAQASAGEAGLSEAATNDAGPASAQPEAMLTPTAADALSGSPVYDDWSYRDAAVSISISKHVSGSGANTLTWFTADLVLEDAQQLASAFADDQFGRNITAYTSEIAAAQEAVLAVNGDYYGFRTNGIIIRNGVIYRDVPARQGLAFYLDGRMRVYDETQTSANELLEEGVWNTLSFGPGLISGGVTASNLGTVEIDTNFGNHPIQGSQPRTGVGMISPNHFVFIVVDGRSSGYSRGATLTEFAQMFAELGCTEAYNLDGGGSSTLYFMGRVVNNPLGRNKERGTSDILYVGAGDSR